MTRARLVALGAADARLERVDAFLNERAHGSELTLVGPSRAATTELLARRTLRLGASFGVHRHTLRGLAVNLALVRLARAELTLAPPLALAALASQVWRELSAAEDRALAALWPHEQSLPLSPGFPHALARSFQELDLTTLLRDGADAGPTNELGQVVLSAYRSFRAALSAQRLATPGDVLCAACAELQARPAQMGDLVLLDVAVRSRLELDFVAALAQRAVRALLCVPSADEVTLRWLSPRFALEQLDGAAEDPMGRFRSRMFHSEHAATPPGASVVSVSAAPGEALEAVEVARRLLGEATLGVRFEDMAVVTRRGARYAPHLAAALTRAGIPFQLEAGLYRPHPSGRAFLSLLSCKLERGSGRRLLEYVASGELPARPSPSVPALLVSEDLGRLGQEPPEGPPLTPDDPPLVRRSLRRWERILGEVGLSHAGAEASVAGYLARRLAAARAQLELLTGDAPHERDEHASSEAIARARAELETLHEMEVALLPVLEALDRLPEEAPAAVMVALLNELADAALRRPDLVKAKLAELAPLGQGVTLRLSELWLLLGPRLSSVEDASHDAVGGVLLSTADGLRGRARRVTLLVGQAEGIMPEQPSEDPLLLDDVRTSLDLGLAVADDRLAEERLLFMLACGAACERFHVSFPRSDAETGRARVPSFYALEALRAATGELLDLSAFERATRPPSEIRTTWPSTREPAQAVDELEYALASVRRLLRDEADPRGRARHLMDEHPFLGRALRTRFRRSDPSQYSAADGLVLSTRAQLGKLRAFGLKQRAYSASSLEAFAACPYRFYLKAILGLAPRSAAEPLDRLDPRLVGELYHEAQAHYARELARTGLTEAKPEGREELVLAMRRALDRAAGDLARRVEALAGPILDREVDALGRDLEGYIDEEIARGDGFWPVLADLAFGIDVSRHAAESVVEPVAVRGGYLLRGAIDVVERNQRGQLRVTDFKTGRLPDDLLRGTPVIAGGKMLQPLLYALVASTLGGRVAQLDAPIVSTRLYYATRKGRYEEVEVAMAEDNLARLEQVLDAADGALFRGRLFAAPREGACKDCDYRAVCGPNRELAVQQKAVSEADRAQHKALIELRGMP